MRIKLSLVVTLALSLAAFAQAAETFTNPVLPAGPDPWVIAYNGTYYYTNTTGRNLTLWKTRDMADLAHAQRKVIWTPPPNTAYSKEIWAPELHRFDNKWFLYFAADDGQNRNHRLYVLENDNDDPLSDAWVFRGPITDSSNKWAIDASAFEANGKRYLLWSGWKGDTNGEQDIYIAQLATPTRVGSPRVRISSPHYGWEKHIDAPGKLNPPNVLINEGPEILQHGNKIFLVYSASACWTDDYALGMLEADASANLLNPRSWKKFDKPVFEKDPAAGVYGPGHNGFFKSPDG
ncbi:MAG: glycoside hydrolase family 43 protein, partial [Bryocella sp.]